MSRAGRPLVLAAVICLSVALSACGGDDGGGTTPAAKSTTSVNVTLQEFSVLPQQASTSAGTVTFVAENKGPEDTHELVVVRTDLAPESLPTNADGSVNEAGTGVQLVGEIEEFPVGQTKQATFELTAGKYILFCNVVDTQHTPPEVHYKLGMRTAFTVV